MGCVLHGLDPHYKARNTGATPYRHSLCLVVAGLERWGGGNLGKASSHLRGFCCVGKVSKVIHSFDIICARLPGSQRYCLVAGTSPIESLVAYRPWIDRH